MPVDEHHFLVADSYSSPVFDHSLVMSFADARHSFSGPSPPNSSVSSKSSMFSIPEHSVDSSDITDPSRDQYTRHGHFADSHHPLSSLVNHSAPQLTLNPAHLTNHSAHASTNRVLTRAQARVLLAQQTDQDSMQAHGLTTNTRKSEINANVRLAIKLRSSFLIANCSILILLTFIGVSYSGAPLPASYTP